MTFHDAEELGSSRTGAEWTTGSAMYPANGTEDEQQPQAGSSSGAFDNVDAKGKKRARASSEDDANLSTSRAQRVRTAAEAEEAPTLEFAPTSNSTDSGSGLLQIENLYSDTEGLARIQNTPAVLTFTSNHDSDFEHTSDFHPSTQPYEHDSSFNNTAYSFASDPPPSQTQTQVGSVGNLAFGNASLTGTFLEGETSGGMNWSFGLDEYSRGAGSSVDRGEGGSGSGSGSNGSGKGSPGIAGVAEEGQYDFDPNPTSLSTWVEAHNAAASGSAGASGSASGSGGDESGSFTAADALEHAGLLSSNHLEVIDPSANTTPDPPTQPSSSSPTKGKAKDKGKAKAHSSPPKPKSTSSKGKGKQPRSPSPPASPELLTSATAMTTSSRPLPPTTPPADPLSSYTCPICFFPPSNATLTPCGHICCGECLFTAVKTTMARNAPFRAGLGMGAGGAVLGPMGVWRAAAGRGGGGAAAGGAGGQALCPVCREEIKGWDGRGGGVVGLKVKSVVSF